MRKLLLAVMSVAVVLAVSPKPAMASEAGLLLAQWGDDHFRHEDDHFRHEEERHREAERARRERFFEFRMHEHFDREGWQWRSLPREEKEHIIREEWERWGERSWGR